MKKLYHINKLESDWKESWLKERKKSLGASDISSILGLNKYKSALALYLDKLDQLPMSEEENIAAELGLELEEFMRKKFVKWVKKNEDIALDVKEMPHILGHDDVDCMTTTLDGHFEHPNKGNCVLEIKTTSEFNREEWKEDQVPDVYYLQVQHQLAVTGWDNCYLAYLIGNRTFDVKIIPRNQKIIDNLIKQAKIFWNDFVLKNVPPAPDGTISSKDALNILYADDLNDEPLDLTKDLGKSYGRYKEIRSQVKVLTSEENDIKQQFMSLMGNNTFAIVDIADKESGEIKTKKIRFRNITRAGYEVSEKTFKQFNIY